MKHPDGRTEDVRVVSGDTTTLGMRHRDGAVCSGCLISQRLKLVPVSSVFSL